MNKTLLITAFAASSLSAHAAIIVGWDFENAPADLTNSAASFTFASTLGTNTGTASGLHLSANTDWTTPAGNGSANSFSSNEWAVGDYYQFTLSTAGFSQVYVSYSQTGSNTGPRDFKLQYSTTGIGGSFVDFSSYAITNDSWNAVTPVPASFRSFDLTAIGALAGNTDVVFRIADTSTTSVNAGTVATGGTGRVDNFIVSDTPIDAPIPEPSTVLTLVSGLGMLGLLRRRPARS
jgi:PEP-CTERM motif